MKTAFQGLALFFIVISCVRNHEKDFIMSSEIKSDFHTLQAHRIYFGHQSVGGNIINGVNELNTQAGVDGIFITNWDENSRLPKSFFAESRIGKNSDPKSKCDAFEKLLTDSLGDNVDIALMKFCYVDFSPQTNVREVFNQYSEMINRVKSRFPGLTIVHVTTPLSSGSGFLKHWLKVLLKGKDANQLENIKRNEYNRLLAENFENDPIFDLAQLESTYPDGQRSYFEKDGQTYYQLVDQYTDDGGHLNKEGRLRAAAAFIHTLANAVEQAQE